MIRVLFKYEGRAVDAEARREPTIALAAFMTFGETFKRCLSGVKCPICDTGRLAVLVEGDESTLHVISLDTCHEGFIDVANNALPAMLTIRCRESHEA